MTQTYDVKLLSFGYLYGLPEADMVLDMRGLKNPYYVPELTKRNGQDKAVQDYILGFAESRAYLEAVSALVLQRLAQWRQSNYAPLCVAFGCSGGQHRSVAMLLLTAQRLQEQGWRVMIAHRDTARWKE